MRRQALLLLAALLLASLILLPSAPIVRYVLAFTFLWVLPGLSWATLIDRGTLGRAERLAVGLGLSWVAVPVAALLGTFLPGPLTHARLLSLITGITVLPLAWSALTYVRERPTSGSPRSQVVPLLPRSWGRWLWHDGWAWLLAALLIGGGLRLVHLNYSEFQGDEATVLVRAARALEGDKEIVLLHTKGPSELAIVMTSWRLAGALDEWMARLPFVWASVLGLVAAFLCGRRLGHPHGGGIAACLLAINGYFVAFGRIVQYQSVVFALTTLGLLCLLAYRTEGRGPLVVVAAALFAGGLLAHYDAALSLPAGLFLVGSRLWSDRRQLGSRLVPVIIGGLTGVALVGTFYVPFLLSPYVELTLSYLFARVGSDQHLFNNLQPLFKLSAVYNSIYFLATIALLLAAYTWLTWAKWRRLGAIGSAVLLAALSTGLLWPEWWQINHQGWAWLPAALLFLGALLSPGTETGIRAMWIWLGAPALLYLFFVAQPWTHIHTAFPASSLLCGVGIIYIGKQLARWSRLALGIAALTGVVIYVLSVAYVVMVFVDHTPEYQRTFPQSQHPLYWTPYDRMPEVGLFGFPYRAGWNVVGHLIDRGELAGSYNSNEEPQVTDYYTRQALRLGYGDIGMYILAQDVQDEINIHWEQVQVGYEPAVVVTVGGRPKLTVYKRDVEGPPLTLAAEHYDRPFAPEMTPEMVSRPASATEGEIRIEEYVPHQTVLGGVVRLLGYKIDARGAYPGGYIELTLLWQGLTSMALDYHVFNHLYDGQLMYGQMDGQPMYGTHPTSHWKPGELVADTYRIPIAEDAPPGLVPLLVGMYDFQTMQRLEVLDASGQPIGDSIHLTDVLIRE